MVVVLSATACANATSTSSPPSTFSPGSPWLGSFAPAALPVPVNSLRDVECATATQCWAVGSTVGVSGAPNGAALITTTDGGATWVGRPIPPTVAYLSAIACSDHRNCTAVGQTAAGLGAVITTSDGGSVWTEQPVPPTVLDITAVSCGSDHRCLALGSTGGGAVALVSSSGVAWSVAGNLPAAVSGASDVSCVGDDQCWVTAYASVGADHVAGVVVLTADGGSTWSVVPTPSGIGELNGVSCLSVPVSRGALPYTSTAASTGANGTTTTTAAGTSPATAPTTAPATTPGGPTATSTPAVGAAGVHCTVVGTTATTLNNARSGHGVLLTSDNGGGTWSRPTVPAVTATLMGVSCTAAATCIAVGSAVALEADGGIVLVTGAPSHAWTRAAAIGVPQPLTAVSCISSTSCVAVGESISEHLAGG